MRNERDAFRIRFVIETNVIDVRHGQTHDRAMKIHSVLPWLCVLLTTPAEAAPFDRDAWMADYGRLKVALAQSYANMDWQIEQRRLNLVGADAFITGMLERADSDAAATLAMVKLVDAFRDPHLQLAAGPPPQEETLAPAQAGVAPPEANSDICAGEGYAPAKPATRLPYPQAPGWKQVGEGPFLAGVIGNIGVLRIPEFSESRYLDACHAVARRGLEGRELQLAARAELNRQLRAKVAALKAAGMKRLVIDLSRNGGGSEWSTEAAALFANARLSRNTPRLAGPTCDRSAIWKGEKPACSIYRGDLPTEIADRPDTPIWSGPLAVLVDRQTASAAEEFATWMQDNGQARIGGEKTFGAGCGYIDGGNTFTFRAAPMHLTMPNCSRIRRDGTNEIEAVTPDVAIDWRTLQPPDVAKAFDRLF